MSRVTRCRTKSRQLALLACVMLGFLASPARATEHQTLFFIARSTNANVVHYDVRLAEKERLDINKPLVAYWVMRAEDGRNEALSWFERQFAYGFDIDSAVTQAGFGLRLGAFSERSVKVRRDVHNHLYAELNIGGRRARLASLYVKTREGGALPVVLYIDVLGTDLVTGKPVAERLLH